MKQYKFKKGQEIYLALDSFSKRTLFNEVFGWKISKDGVCYEIDKEYASAFVYFYRRFGASIIGHDDYKTLCHYILTTPVKGYYLSVYFESYGFISFALYCEDKNLQWDIIHEERKIVMEYFDGLKAWAKENNREYFIPLNEGEEKTERKYLEWFEQNKSIFESWDDTKVNQKKAVKMFYNEMEIKSKETREAYPIPFPENTKNDNTPLKDSIMEIFKKALKELLKPVYIRDTYCNINGYYNGIITAKNSCVPYKFAGYGYEEPKPKETKAKKEAKPDIVVNIGKKGIK